MVVDNNQQSASGRIASGYSKVAGYTNMVGVILGYIFGGLLLLVGILLAFLFGNFVVFLAVGGMGILIIFLAWLGAKSSKKMREGKYYQLGKGWTQPQ